MVQNTSLNTSLTTPLLQSINPLFQSTATSVTNIEDQLIIGHVRELEKIEKLSNKEETRSMCCGLVGKLANFGGSLIQLWPNITSYGTVTDDELDIIGKKDDYLRDEVVTGLNYGACAIMLSDVACVLLDQKYNLPMKSDSVGNLVYGAFKLCCSSDETAKTAGQWGSLMLRLCLFGSSTSQLCTGRNLVSSISGELGALNSVAGTFGDVRSGRQADQLQNGVTKSRTIISNNLKDDLTTITDNAEKIRDTVANNAKKLEDTYNLLTLERKNSHDRHETESENYKQEIEQLKLKIKQLENQNGIP